MTLMRGLKFVLGGLLFVNFLTAICSAGVRELGTEQGLSQTSVLSVFQSSEGFLWIGTQDGLNRYDGYEWVVFRSAPGDPHSLSDNFIFWVIEARNGVLWVGTKKGLNRYDPTSGLFQPYRANPNEPGHLSHDWVTCILENPDGTLWVGTYNGLNLFDPQSGSWRVFKSVPNQKGSLSDNSITHLYRDGNGVLWVGTGTAKLRSSYGGGLNRFLPQQEQFRSYQLPEGRTANITALLDGGPQQLWVGTYDQGLFQFDKQLEQWTPFGKDVPLPKEVTALLINTNYLWIGTVNGGLFRHDLSLGKTVEIDKASNNTAGFAGNEIVSLLLDRFGGMWIGTWNSGLKYLDLQAQAFKSMQFEAGDGQGVNSTTILGMAATRDGKVWFNARTGGLCAFSPQDRDVKVYRHDPSDPGSCPKVVRGVVADDEDQLWMGSQADGLVHFDPKMEQFRRFPMQGDGSTGLSHNHVVALVQGKGPLLWVGTRGGGLCRFNKETLVFKAYRHDANHPKSQVYDNIEALGRSSDGLIWVGTYEGLKLIHPDDEKYALFRQRDERPGRLNNYMLSAFCHDGSSTMWVGSLGGGLFKVTNWDRRSLSGEVENISSADGLAADAIGAILKDQEGRLWISTTKGLSHFDPVTGNIKNYNRSDGLQPGGFYVNSACAAPWGEFYFGGPLGFTRFYPASVLPNTVPPSVVLTRFLLFNKTVQPASLNPSSSLPAMIGKVNHLELSYKDYIVTFEFAGIHFADPARNRYAYRLEGLDENWINTDAENRRATYTTLPAGNYKFVVKASNKDGAWSDVDTSLSIRVLPPWWKTPWAYGLYFLGAVGLAWGLFGIRLRHLQRHKAELGRQVALRTAELAANNRELETLDQIVKDINREHALDRLLNLLLEQGINLVSKAQNGWFVLLDPSDGLYRLTSSKNEKGQSFDQLRLTASQAMQRYSGGGTDLGQGVYLLNSRHYNQLPPLSAPEALPVPKASIAMSLSWKGETSGFLVLDNYEDEDAFSQQDIALLMRLREHAISAISKARTMQELLITSNRLRNTREELMKAAHFAGMAEVASNFMHTVGNSLNTLNISADYIEESLRQNDLLSMFDRVLGLMEQHKADLADFLTKDKKGQMIPNALAVVCRQLRSQNERLNEEIGVVKDYIRSIDRVLESQQDIAVQIDFQERVKLDELIADVLKIHENEFSQRKIQVSQIIEPMGVWKGSRNKILHVINHLVKNAYEAMLQGDREAQLIVKAGKRSNGQVFVSVSDNGHGIADHHFQELYTQGFSTKPGSGGFGLHYCATTIDEIGGSIAAESGGPGKGATFTVRLPVSP